MLKVSYSVLPCSCTSVNKVFQEITGQPVVCRGKCICAPSELNDIAQDFLEAALDLRCAEKVIFFVEFWRRIG